MIRWVIVAQLTDNAHQPTVYGTWETEEAAQAQLERWENRIAATLDDANTTGIALTVEPMFGKSAARFERDFLACTGLELARSTTAAAAVQKGAL